MESKKQHLDQAISSAHQAHKAGMQQQQTPGHASQEPALQPLTDATLKQKQAAAYGRAPQRKLGKA